MEPVEGATAERNMAEDPTFSGIAPEELDALSQKAFKLAKDSDDIEKMLKAVQLKDAIYELRCKTAGNTWTWIAKFAAPYTAIAALILSMATLGWQYHTAVKTAEMTQWREGIKAMSVKDDSSVLSSLLQMQTFFDVPSYAAQSRASAAALLPLVGDGSEFDITWQAMKIKTNRQNQTDLIAIAQNVSSEEFALFYNVTGKKFSSDLGLFIDFIVDPDRPEKHFTNEEAKSVTKANSHSEGAAEKEASGSPQSSPNKDVSAADEYARDQVLRPIKRANATSWKLNSMSKGLAVVWKKNGLPENKDLTGMILIDADFSELDFSGFKMPSVIHHCDLTGAKFTNAHLEDAVIWGIAHFDHSEWDGANWWDAKLISCELASYLSKKYPPADKDTLAAENVMASCPK